MDFDLTNDQKDITKAAREFAEKEFSDLAQECDREEKSLKHL
jgi:alkylation response protein AidB-like acyl-CoA dehydrogenase